MGRFPASQGWSGASSLLAHATQAGVSRAVGLLMIFRHAILGVIIELLYIKETS